MGEPRNIIIPLIMLSAFSVMITAVGAVGFFAISPLQKDIAVLKIESNRDKADANARFDALKADLNARIAEINRILEHKRRGR